MKRDTVRRAFLLGASALALAACSVPSSMHVRTGNDPDKVDDLVRFRTTYYFRVFDACEGVNEPALTTGQLREDSIFGGKKKGPFQLRTDSLYRFHMTGKGSALANRIHFESGSLRKDQIEPFGATVAYDQANGRFYFKSQEETEREARRSAKYAELSALRKLRDELKTSRGADTTASSAVDQVITAQIELLKPAEVTARPGATGAAVAGTQLSVNPCPQGSVNRRGFQILGPEGWRTFDQDERLLMAMSSSAKPLVGMLQDLSSRVLNAKPTTQQVLIPLLQEQLRTREALDAAKVQLDLTTGETNSAVEAIVAAFNGARQ